MSNYHGAPYYGAPYNHNGHIPPPIPPPPQEGVHYGTIAQPGYHQYRSSIPLQSPQNIHPPQFGNPYAYNTNAQYSAMGVHGAIAAPPPPLPQFTYQAYPQYPASGPPQPPFPPFHVANHNASSQRLAASVPLPPSPHVFQPSTNLPPKPMPPAPLRPETRNIIPENADAVTVAVGVGEDSEVNEVQLHEALNNSSLAVSAVLPQVNGKHGGISNVTKKDVLQPSNPELPVSLKDSPQRSGLPTTSQSGLGSDRIGQNPQQSSPILKNTRSSAHAPEKRLSEQTLEPLTVKKDVLANSANSHIEGSLASKSPALPLSSQSVQLCEKNAVQEGSHVNFSPAQGRLQQPLISIKTLENTRRPQDLREKVKLALRELHKENIRFVNLVGEGINPSLLKELYDEIGIRTTEIISPKGQHSSDSEPTHTANAKSDSTTSNFDALVPSPAKSTPTSAKQPTSITLTTSNPVVQTKPLTNLPPGHPSPPPGALDVSKGDQAISIALSSLRKSKPTAYNSNKVLPNPNTDRALERKDYIAKMLAAKTGKGTTARAPKLMVSSGSETVPANQKITTANADIPTTLKVFEPEMKQDMNNTQEELEAKKKASTELARRKIEALKIRSTDVQGTYIQANIDTPIASVTPMHEPSQASENALGQPAGRLILPDDTQLPMQYIVSSVSTVEQYTPATPFFAPLEQRPVNGLPGLPGLSMSYPPFTAPNTIEQSTGNQIIKSPNSSPSSPTSERGNPINHDLSVQQSHLTSSNEAKLSLKKDSLATAEETLTNTDMKPEYFVADIAVTSPSTTVVVSEGQINPRKRATASDFIDNQTDSVKLQRGPKGRVVIEVSEDEDANEEDAMELDNTLEPDHIESRNTAETRDYKVKASRDIPPLSSIPTWSKASVTSTTSTPPPVQTPGKSSEPEELARAEEKIRLLKQMIAEREERQRAKHTSISGGQSPHSATISSINDQASLKTSVGKTSSATQVVEKEQALEGVRQGLEAQKTMIVAAEKVMQANLESEKRAQASVVARAEEERKEAARATTTAERQYRERRKATLEAALPELDAQISKATLKLDEMRKQKEELEAEIQRGSEGRKKILEELDVLLLDLENARPSEDGDQMQLDEQLDEFVDASGNTPGSSMEPRTLSTEPYDLATPMFSVHTASNISPSNSVRSATPATHKISSNESPDENMDISSSSDDEGQLATLLREFSPERQVITVSNSGDDEYEPPLDANILLQHSPHRDSSMDSNTASNPLQITRNVQGNVSEKLDSPVEDNSSLEEGEVSGNVSPADAGDSEDYEPPEPLSPVDNRADHPAAEDFRPKPPSTDLEQEQVHPELVTAVAEARTIVDISSDTDVVSNGSKPTDISKSVDIFKSNHFTPYDSPLKLFTSYRYHPKYVSEVPGGFRSLTYSHKINSKEPLCTWELAGGTCNDDSCVYQHFRSMPLTDDMILVQLSSTNEGNTPEEKNAYVSGLKRIIRNMRERRITDFNTVAQEITAYRSSFLGDSSRVLTL